MIASERSIKLNCELCRHPITVASSSHVRHVRCPKCGRLTIVFPAFGDFGRRGVRGNPGLQSLLHGFAMSVALHGVLLGLLTVLLIPFPVLDRPVIISLVLESNGAEVEIDGTTPQAPVVVESAFDAADVLRDGNDAIAAATLGGHRLGNSIRRMGDTRSGGNRQEPVISNTFGMKLVLIPAGEFIMGGYEMLADGSKKPPKTGHDEELPRHQVRISKAFYMGQYEVTLGQFLKFRDATKYQVDIERDGQPSYGYDESGKLIRSNRFRPWAPLAWKPGMDHPVVYVSWNDAVAFCEG